MNKAKVDVDVEQRVRSVVLELSARKHHAPAEVRPEHHLIADLGLDSLDIAELVATLEVELGSDPFAESASIADVHTVGDLIAVYTRHVGS